MPRKTSRRRPNPLLPREPKKPQASDFSAPQIILSTDYWSPDREKGDEEPRHHVGEYAYRGITMGFSSVEEAKSYLQERTSEFSGTCFYVFEFQIHPKHGPSWKYIGDLLLRCPDYADCYVTDQCEQY